ncbi:putative holin-like toxin [Paenibacillus sp. NRS-1782]
MMIMFGMIMFGMFILALLTYVKRK